MLFALLFHDDGFVALLARALHGTYSASLAVIVIEPRHLLVFHDDGGIGAVNPAEQALDAVLFDPAGLERSPGTRLVRIRVAGVEDRAGVGQLFPVHLL